MSIELQGNVHESELGVDKETLGGYGGRANTAEELCGFGARLRRASRLPAKANPSQAIKGMFSRLRRRSVAEESSGG